MQHPPSTVRMAHQILENLKEGLDTAATLEQLEKAVHAELSDFMVPAMSAETPELAAATGRILTALWIAADIAAWLTRVDREAVETSLRLTPGTRAQFWQEITAGMREMSETGDTTAAHETLNRWSDIADIDITIRSDQFEPPAINDDPF